MSEWTSVKDRLPDEKTRVLVFVPHSDIWRREAKPHDD